eukprot:m.393806 g.393806  ORF g.393806 m.393806 type:complete len:1041 (+) comp56363_c0_seq1:1284-4406(+)
MEWRLVDALPCDDPALQNKLDQAAALPDGILRHMRSLADATQALHQSGTAERSSMKTFAASMRQAADSFTFDSLEIKNPLLLFSDTLEKVDKFRDYLLFQTESEMLATLQNSMKRLAGAKDVYNKAAQSREFYEQQRVKALRLAHADKAAEGGEKREEFCKRMQKLFDARMQARLDMTRWIAFLKNEQHTNKVRVVLKVVEQMLSIYSFFNLAFSCMKDTENSMKSLLESLSELQVQAELSYQEDVSNIERMKTVLSAERDADLKSLSLPETTAGLPQSPKFSGLRLFKGARKVARSQFTRQSSKDDSDTAFDFIQAANLPPPLLEAAESEFEATVRSSLHVPGADQRGLLNVRLENKQWALSYCAIEKAVLVSVAKDGARTPIVNLALANVRPSPQAFIDRNFCFEVVTHKFQIVLQALTQREYDDWLLALQSGVAEGLENSLTANKAGDVIKNPGPTLHSIPGNDRCVDCDALNPEWASINLGILMCIECSGTHRSLGVQFSKVRSIALDRWMADTIEFMKQIGNRSFNAVCETRLAELETNKPVPTSASDLKASFIRLKYIDLKFAPTNVKTLQDIFTGLLRTDSVERPEAATPVRTQSLESDPTARRNPPSSIITRSISDSTIKIPPPEAPLAARLPLSDALASSIGLRRISSLTTEAEAALSAPHLTSTTPPFSASAGVDGVLKFDRVSRLSSGSESDHKRELSPLPRFSSKRDVMSPQHASEGTSFFQSPMSIRDLRNRNRKSLTEPLPESLPSSLNNTIADSDPTPGSGSQPFPFTDAGAEDLYAAEVPAVLGGLDASFSSIDLDEVPMSPAREQPQSDQAVLETPAALAELHGDVLQPPLKLSPRLPDLIDPQQFLLERVAKSRSSSRASLGSPALTANSPANVKASPSRQTSDIPQDGAPRPAATRALDSPSLASQSTVSPSLPILEGSPRTRYRVESNPVPSSSKLGILSLSSLQGGPQLSPQAVLLPPLRFRSAQQAALQQPLRIGRTAPSVRGVMDDMVVRTDEVSDPLQGLTAANPLVEDDALGSLV